MSDYAPLAFGIVGGAVGAMFGMPWLGYAVGSMVGSAAFPPAPVQARGPRLSDLKVQSSTYGRMVPIVAGKVRIAGNVIWATEIHETLVRDTQSVGGKGGGQKVEQTNYQYSVSLAIALCEGPIGGVSRIWANGKPFHVNPLPVAAGGGPFPVIWASYIASVAKTDRMRVYTGSESQAPDPLITSIEGASATPAYRGVAYVVVEDLQLADFGNAIPNFEFEVVSAGTMAPEAGALDADSPLGTPLSVNGSITPDGLALVSWVYQTSPFTAGRLALCDPTTMMILREYDVLSWDVQGASAAIAPRINQQGDLLYQGGSGALWHWAAGGAAVNLGLGSHVDARIAVDEAGNFWVADVTGGTAGNLLRYQPGSSTGSVVAALAYPPRDLWYGWDGYLYVAIANTTDGRVEQRKVDGGALVRSCALRRPRSICVAGDGSLWVYTYEVTNTGDLYRISPDWLSETLILDNSGSGTGNNRIRINRDWATGDVLWVAFGNVRRYAASGTLLHTYDLGSVDAFEVVTQPGYPERIYFFDNVGTVGPFVAAERLDALTPATMTIGSVVSTLAQRAGLGVGDLDVTALTDTMDGYALAGRGPARDAIAPLAAAYFFDAVESAGVLKFVKRNAASALTIAEDDLSAHFSGETRPDAMEETRTDESQLPLEISINYFDKDADYQPSTQYERRLTPASANLVTIELPVVMPANKAKQVAAAMLHEAWVARAQRRFSVSTKYTKIEPTDVISVTMKDGATLAARITRKDESRGIIRLEGVDHEAGVYTQSATGAAAPTPDGTIPNNGPTNLALLDIPLLRDQDDTYGFYAAGGGMLDGWPGGKVFKSSDGGASYQDIGAAFLNGAGAIGFAQTALPNFGGGNIFDELSTVEVQLTSGTLTNTTRGNALNGVNAALVGGEILCFTTATELATKKYRLTGLLRGRLGTESAMSRHLANDSFALLNADTLLRISSSAAELYVARLYKAVTFGAALDLASARSFTLQANCLKPLPPVQIGGGRNAANDVIIKWKRRARKGGAWSDYIDVALDEPTESYETETYAGTVRSINAITQAADGQFTTTVAHGYSVNDRIHITGLVGPTQVNDRVYTITSVPTTTTFLVGENTAAYAAYISGGSVRKRGRILTSSTATVTYTSGDQTTDYGSAQNPVYVAVHQMSSRVGRGFAGIGVI